MIQKNIFFILAAMFFAASPAFAQGTVLITGRMIDADSGKPIAGAGVTIGETGKHPVFDPKAGFFIEAKVGDTLRFSCSGYKTETHVVLKKEFYDMGDIRLQKEALSDTGGPAKPEAKRAAPGTVIVSGIVISADGGKPLEYATVFIPVKMHHTATNTAGRFFIAAEVGDTLNFTFPGYKMVKHIVSKKGKYDIGNVFLNRVPAAQRTATVTGRVIYVYDGKPLRGVTVTVGENGKNASTDAAGRFAITAKVGDILDFILSGYIPAIHTVTEAGDYDIGDVLLMETKDLLSDDTDAPEEKRADRGTANVTGRVIYVDNGKPLRGVTVTVGENGKTASTDAAGHFAITAEVGKTIKFSFSGYVTEIYFVPKAGDYRMGDIELKKKAGE